MLSMGLDLSSTSSGVVLLGGGDEPIHQGLWRPKTELDYIDRASWQAEKLIAILGNHQPDKIVIEGYSLGSANGAEPLMTVGTVIRYFLRQYGYAWEIAAPQQLKKYAGAQQKEDIKLAAYKRWGFEHKSNDVVDAYVLAKIGLHMADPDRPGYTQAQKEVVGAILHPKPKKSRKKKSAE